MAQRHLWNSAWSYVAAALLGVVAVWGIAYALVAAEEGASDAAAAEQARRLAVFFERSTLAIFRYGDAYLKMVRRVYEPAYDVDAVRTLMEEIPLDSTIASHVTIIDASGVPRLVSGHTIKPGSSAADRDYFVFQRDARDDQLLVSLPHLGRNSGKLIVRLVRRLTAADGSFAGVIFVALEANSVTEFFNTMNLGPSSSATLVGTDKRIRARSSYGRLGPGQDISGSRIWKELAVSPVGLYLQTSVVDGVTRYYAYRRLQEFPLIVAIGVAVDDIGSAISRFRTPTYLIAALITLILTAAAFMLAREARTKALRVATERRLRTVLETVLDGIVTVRADGRLDSFNSGASGIFGYTADEVCEKSVALLAADPNDPTWTALAAGRRPAGGEDGYVQVDARRKDGSLVPVELSVGDMHDREQLALVVTVRDITERVEAERTIQRMHDELELRVDQRTEELAQVQGELLRKERLAALGQLTGTVAHELRNPLATVVTSVAVIERKLVGSGIDLERPLERIHRNVERCNNIITELLDFTRARGLAPQPTELDSWLAELLAEVEVREPVRLVSELNTDGAVVAFDRDRLRRAVINLIDNARDALLETVADGDPARDLRIEVRTRRRGDRIEIEVGDNGIGIEPELMRMIKEPLFSTKSFGVGLGLPVIQGVMDEHEGGFEMHSEQGEGTTATIWLPTAVAQEARLAQSHG